MMADPSAMRLPFGWPSVMLVPEGGNSLLLEPCRLRSVSSGQLVSPFSAAVAGQGGWVSFCVSGDNRDEKQLSVRLAQSGRELGVVDLRYVHSIAPFRLRLEPADFSAALREGVHLSLTQAQTPLWLFGEGLPQSAAALEPAFLLDDVQAEPPLRQQARTDAFFDCLASASSVQTFGWMEGCLLDAFQDLHVSTGDRCWQRALEEHLSLFITAEGRLVYETPRGLPSDNAIYGIEGTLPYAVIAKMNPAHSLIDELLLPFYCGRLCEDGSFVNPGEMYSAEASYTVSYPLAVVAQMRNDSRLAGIAANMLRHNRAKLRPDGSDIWLRYFPADRSRTFRSWARGVAWYLQGLVRTLEAVGGLTDTEDLFTELESALTWAVSLQRPDGLWGCFLTEPDTPYDTSGSAGIAAAVARAGQLGLLRKGGQIDSAAAAAAGVAAWRGLLPHLTPDGFLGGAAQSNRGGEALQRSSYRVISPMGMGLMGQLAAVLPQEALS